LGEPRAKPLTAARKVMPEGRRRASTHDAGCVGKYAPGLNSLS
jgi:hypothetical protein